MNVKIELVVMSVVSEIAFSVMSRLVVVTVVTSMIVVVSKNLNQSD